jgi:hypothetical protein
MKIIRTDEEIESIYEQARQGEANGSKFPGMSYEEGIVALLDWLTTPGSDSPLD